MRQITQWDIYIQITLDDGTPGEKYVDSFYEYDHEGD
jgi:hypothetical protein